MSSYLYSSTYAPTRCMVIDTHIIRAGLSSVLFDGAQSCRALGVTIVDPSQASPNTYAPIGVFANLNGGPTLSDSIEIDGCRVEVSAGNSIQYMRPIQFDITNRPANCAVRNCLLDPGTGADGNGKFIGQHPSVYVSLQKNQARVLQTHTANNTAPSVLGTDFFVLNFSAPNPLNNLGDYYEGQEIVLVAANANCEIQNNSNFVLRDGLKWDMPSGAWIRLRRYGSTDPSGAGSKWYELGRSTLELARVGDGGATQVGYGFANESGLGLRRTTNHGIAITSNSVDIITASDQGVAFNPSGTQKMQVNATGVAFYGAAASGQPTISGSKGANAALGSLLSALANMGLVVDTTT